MGQNKDRRIFYIVVSILVSAFVWFYVNNSEVVTISVDDIPVEFLNEDTTLADRGLMLLNSENTTVDLKLQVPRNIVFRFDTNKIRIVADLSSISTPGKQSLGYTILYPSNIAARDVTVDSPSVRTVSVEIGELSRKEVEVRCKVVGSVAENYIAGTLHILPDMLEVRGQQVDIMQVNYAQVTLNISHATSTIVELLDYELYDFNDQVINNPNIHPVSDQIQVTMPVMTVKEVPLVVHFVESPGVRLASFDYKIDPSTVTLSGDAAAVNAINEIVLDTLELSTLSESERFTYDIVLPDGINNLSGITSASLEISSQSFQTLEIEATLFSYENFDASRSVSIVTSTLPVTLRGTPEEIAKVTAQDVHVVADLTDIADASGSYTVPARIQVDKYDIGAVGTYEVTVHIGGENG